MASERNPGNQMKNSWLGDIEHLQRFETFIEHDSVTQLRDYFRLGGMDKFDRSPLYQQLYQAEMFSANIAPCLYCGGIRNDETPGLDVGGLGFIMDLTALTPKMLARVKREIGRESASNLKITDGIDCPVCNHTGWVTTTRRKRAGEQITARPSKTASAGATHHNNVDVQWGTCAMVDRILTKADTLFPLATQILASCFGPVNYGTMGVWHITPAGKTLLRRNTEDKDDVLFFVGLKDDDAAKQSKTLSSQLKAAEEQAKAAIDAAYQAWNAALFASRCGV